MRIQKIVLIGGFICICSLFAIIGVHAQDEASDNRVTATFATTFQTGTDLQADITMDVQRFTTDKTYTSSDIKSTNTSQEIQDLRAIIRYYLYERLRSQFQGVYGDSSLLNFTMPTYSTSTQTFIETLNVQLSPSFFNLNQSVDAESFINGVLDMDAVVYYTCDFKTETGWNNTHQIILPSTIQFRYTDGIVSGQTIQWSTENWNGLHPNRTGSVSIQFTHPTTPHQTTDDISLEFTLDATKIKTTTFDTTFITNSLNISSYNIMPFSITNIDVITADGIRLFVKNNLLSWDVIYQKTLQNLEQTISSTIEQSTFNQPLDLTFTWDSETTTNCSTPYTTTHMDSIPPVKATLTDADVDLKIFNITAKAVFGLANAGAIADVTSSDINFGDKLSEIGRPYTCSLMLPSNIYLTGKSIYQWNDTNPPSGELTSSISPTYSKEEKKMYVTTEITKMDLNLPSFFTGKTELTAPLDIKEDIDLYLTSLPEEFTLPEHLYLTYLNSDAFRLCAEEKVFTDQETSTFLANKKQQFETRMSEMLHGLKINGASDTNKFAASLRWDGDIAKMDKNTPVIVASNARCIYPVACSLSLAPPSFSISTQNITLMGFTDQSVTYRFVFPKGITVTASDTLEKQITYGKTIDGTNYIELTLDEKDSPETDALLFTMTADPLYVLGLFLPCILTLFLVIILIVVIYLIRRKRGPLFVRGEKKPRRRKSRRTEESEEADEEGGFEGQEFYVPPPPGSR
ncbi:MAG: hypothetical protein NT038_04960 [Euryarchaeota archaeon]|nr:hypothetical protein [Euryarchaeota archaeon]